MKQQYVDSDKDTPVAIKVLETKDIEDTQRQISLFRTEKEKMTKEMIKKSMLVENRTEEHERFREEVSTQYITKIPGHTGRVKPVVPYTLRRRE